MKADDCLIDLAVAVGDGDSIDWDAVEARTDPSNRAVVRYLRLVDRIASVHASLPPLCAFERSLHDSLRQQWAVGVPVADEAPSTWGPLAIIKKIGSGSYADVYLAHDPRLDRPVALKLLRHREHTEALESVRIEEARLLARVRHPNVVTVYGAERIDRCVGIWMEFVDGRTLDQELHERGPFSADELVTTGLALCRALTAVHDTGLLHRDVKAQNVMRDRDGRVLLTDFGTGREVAEVVPTGELAGTPMYLAPEVLDGKAASIATDVYSLGVLLHRLATGSFPITGRSIRDLRDAHARGAQARVRDARPDLPEDLAAVIDRATAAEPARRYQSAAETEAALATTVQPHAAGAAPRRRLVFAAALLLTALVIGVMAVVAVVIPTRGAVTIVLGQHTRLTGESELEFNAAISPDGMFVAYSAGQPGRMHVLVREISSGRSVRLTDKALGDERRPRWSPDGSRVLFTAGGMLYTIPATGGTAPTLVTNSTFIRSAAWSPDGRSILFIAGDKLFRVAATGGTPGVVRRLELDASGLSLSPDGSRIAYVIGNPDFDIGTTQFANIGPSVIRIAATEGGPAIELTGQGHLNASPVWSADAQSMFFVSDREGHRDIYVLDVDGQGTPGRPRRVTSGLGAHGISLSADGGMLAYSVFARRANVWSIGIPARGVARLADAEPLTAESQTIEQYVVSPDGRWLYFDSDRYGNSDLFRMRIGGGQPERLTSDPNDEFISDVSADGRELAFHAFRNGRREVLVMPAEGGRATFVAAGLAPRWSPDGSRLVVADVLIPEIVGTTHRVLHRTPDDQWASPQPLGDEKCVDVQWRPDGQSFIAVCGGALRIRAPDGIVMGTLYAPGNARDPMPRAFHLPPGDTVYFKSYDDDGYPSFWSLPLTGGTPRPVVRIDDPTRHASRAGFWADGQRLYFTLEERQSDVWVVAVGDSRP